MDSIVNSVLLSVKKPGFREYYKGFTVGHTSRLILDQIGNGNEIIDLLNMVKAYGNVFESGEQRFC